MQAYFTNDAIVLGLLMAVLAIIFYLESSKKPFWVKFFTYVPSLLLCYFVPALLKWPLGLVDGEVSQLYYVASRYLLPAALILLCLGIDFKGIMRLGPKAIIMFLAGTIGIILGGPIALLVIEYLFPSLIPSNLSVNELWRGMSTIAGSWIGGGANQTAMKEVFEVADNIFGIMIVVDVIVANIWMGFLLYGANIRDKANRLLKADNTAILDLEKRMEDYNSSVKKIPTTTEVFILMAVAFGGVALAHWGADIITPFMEERIESLKNMNLQSLASGFFWLVVIATTIGLALSFTSARKLEGVGATRWGSVFIYVLVATIGMKMDLAQIFDKDNIGLFVIGLTWMLVHVIILLLVAKMIKAPFFFVAVGSQANVGGAASAPIVASAFNPSLASVGVLMAVLGYALGTYGALICAILMEMVATG
ncbi:Predicted integral membrane protein [Candidatus Ornithobacterium hominis]|uniref:Predicted integral membrane protein n=1 Tax=Candidatus Ornithobacterium hominis TaxID=2497989 RepID=A0A383U3I1_9FLAO|nr:DUF819 family protein [Candidatus Ornithobacterium hominis]MCT7905063.1 DUF819 family protein [Candidatus Ornithobacterium hominis]SZD74100.1 Predicted integral membrane protein [Candidatus Ornithobacterium hominis]